jgi:hypothetical protein
MKSSKAIISNIKSCNAPSKSKATKKTKQKIKNRKLYIKTFIKEFINSDTCF